ncbi:MAG: hypothetical protein ABJL17_06820 [Parvibaculum sp.]|uniref:hypothetical protein n=1 Tax=Parvibaculum sp. TaxID=2024848 RepID=UPI0032631405
MMNRFFCQTATCLFAALALCGPAMAEHEQFYYAELIENHNYRIVAMDSTEHVLRVRYRIWLNGRTWQSGDASGFDNRKCHGEQTESKDRLVIGSYEQFGDAERKTRFQNPIEPSSQTTVDDLGSWLGASIDASVYDWSKAADVAGHVIEEIANESNEAARVLGIIRGGVALTFEFADALGKSILRSLGLRSANCAEVRSQIEKKMWAVWELQKLEFNRDRIQDYYINTITVWDKWKYYDEDKKIWVRAAAVLPVEKRPGDDAIAILQAALIYARELKRWKPTESIDQETLQPLLQKVVVNSDWHKDVYSMFADTAAHKAMELADRNIPKLREIAAEVRDLPEPGIEISRMKKGASVGRGKPPLDFRKSDVQLPRGDEAEAIWNRKPNYLELFPRRITCGAFKLMNGGHISSKAYDKLLGPRLQPSRTFMAIRKTTEEKLSESLQLLKLAGMDNSQLVIELEGRMQTIARVTADADEVRQVIGQAQVCDITRPRKLLVPPIEIGTPPLPPIGPHR